MTVLDTRPLTVSLKCEPSLADALRAEHAAIQPGYHLNKRHWITVTLDDSLLDELVFELIEDSYELVVNELQDTSASSFARARHSRGRRRGPPPTGWMSADRRVFASRLVYTGEHDQGGACSLAYCSTARPCPRHALTGPRKPIYLV